MQVILAVVTDSPYRGAVLAFGDDLARLVDGDLWTLTLTRRPSPDETEALAQVEGLGESADEEAAALVPEGIGSGETEARPLHRVIRAAGAPIEAALRGLAHCDFGVVGKGLHAEPTGGAGIGPDVERLKGLSTKPLAIVPQEVRPIQRALFVYTEHPESGHALSLALPLAQKGVAIELVTLIPSLGRTELLGTGAGYLKAHNVPFDTLDADCANCREDGGPVGEVLHHAKQENVDLVVMGGTRRGLVGRLLWPEMAREVVWNAHVPVLIWY